MKPTDVIVIGAGHAGLAMSHVLSSRGIDHFVLERGRVAERWQSERWDSLRLLTPNWCSRLPGWRYRGPDPDGFMTMAEVTRYLEGYARAFGAPVRTGVTVTSVFRAGERWHVATDQGAVCARAVVIATGHCNMPHVPEMARALPGDVHQITPGAYRNPGALPDGGVLVVGASASGVQIADELHAAGREVTLAVGRHVRLPRRYRGRDIIWWMDRTGMLTDRIERMPDPDAARGQPSLQLIGGTARRQLDLATLARSGVRVLGRAHAVAGRIVHFAGDLAETTAAAERKLIRTRRRIDDFIDGGGATSEIPAPEPYAPVALHAPAQAIDLKDEGIATVVWATGFRRSYGWLKAPVFDARGELRHKGGVTPQPGLYAIGLRFQRCRNSSFIDGAGADAEALGRHIVNHLDAACRVAV